VIEVDGSVHDSRDAKESDEGRTYELKELGITVLRFRNEEVLNDMSLVLKKIKEVVERIADKK